MRRTARQRIVRLAALAAVICASVLSVPGSGGAHPPAPFGPGAKPITGTMHRWLHQSKAPLVDGRVHVLIGGCPGAPLFVGCIFIKRPRVIYLSPAARRPRAVLYHELGHTFDIEVMQPRHREKFKRIMGIRTRGWFTSRPPAAEWFADAYTLCAEQRHLRASRPATPYGYRATPRGHARVCELIRDAAGIGKPKKRRPKPRPPADAPKVSEPHVAPPPGAPTDPPTGPFQPPLVKPPPYSLPDCDLIEQLVTGCKRP
jgi:hypothetical protein